MWCLCVCVCVCVYDVILHSHKKGQDHAIWDKGGLRGYYANQKKLDWEKQVPYDSTHKWNLKKMNRQTKSRIRTVNAENKLVVARGEAVGRLGKMCEGERELQASSYGISKSQKYNQSIRNTLNDIIIAM